MHWEIIWDYRFALLQGLQLTVLLSVVGIAGSLAWGTFLACLDEIGGEDVRSVVAVYIEIMGDLPTIALLFIIYFVAAADAVPAALLTLILHQGAYIASVVISGFRTLPREQMESAHASGLTRVQALWHVALPQVMRSVVPAMANQFIEVIKNTSAAMLIGVHELTFQTQEIAQQTFRGFEASTVVTGIYVALALAVAYGASTLQKKWGVK
ncbi:amino acid ABC transporter permease [Ancylobacter mangrovi]|uniref:amino acid ABC transporter permease n=1 Tax=Ancylobacter mangrovi TaxID=2972472 RepID=UPI002162B4F2|nr:amino acid ABC transporter permease [Ancylobacter mangrovi]MCS0503363.1 amino acid ABC transporter permease [Ancylobacter mangrovi]